MPQPKPKRHPFQRNEHTQFVFDMDGQQTANHIIGHLIAQGILEEENPLIILGDKQYEACCQEADLDRILRWHILIPGTTVHRTVEVLSMSQAKLLLDVENA